MALAVDARTAVVVITTTELVLTAVAMVRERAHIAWRPVLTIVLASLLGIPIGLFLLLKLNGRALNVIIAVVVLSFVVILARGIHLKRSLGLEVGAGAVSGVLLAATGMNGPPLVAVFQAMGLPQRQFRATLQAVFTIQVSVVVAGFGLTHQFSASNLIMIAVACPAIIIGWGLGDRLFRRFAPEQFRRVVLGTLVISGCLTLASALI